MASRGEGREAYLKLVLIALVLFATNLNAQQSATPASTAAAQMRPASDYVNSDLPRWFRLSGEYRTRLEAIGGTAYQENASDAFVLGRLRLNTTFIPISWMKIQLQAQDA